MTCRIPGPARVVRLALLLAACLGLAACTESRPGFLKLAPDMTFATAKAELESQGFVFQGREPEPFVLTVADVDEYYTFHADTKALARMAKVA